MSRSRCCIDILPPATGGRRVTDGNLRICPGGAICTLIRREIPDESAKSHPSAGTQVLTRLTVFFLPKWGLRRSSKSRVRSGLAVTSVIKPSAHKYKEFRVRVRTIRGRKCSIRSAKWQNSGFLRRLQVLAHSLLTIRRWRIFGGKGEGISTSAPVKTNSEISITRLL